MSSKKLQTEIDRTLKKVTEGLEVFHETLDKLNGATTQNQKEKYEVDLKKEIKKLQRLRDNLKVWQTSSEIKDKQPINEARKSIETQMEKFKILEKELKIKAFSKEGLNQTTKLDPKVKEKIDLANWINSTVDKLSTQIDAYDAEVETMGLNLKKGKKLEPSKQERNDLLIKTVEKHKNHVKKLEAILRLMENDQVTTEQVSGLKDELEYYIESNLEDDFMENEEMYDDFDFSSAPESDSDSDLSDSEDEPVQRKKVESSVPVSKPPSIIPPQPKPSIAATTTTNSAGAAAIPSKAAVSPPVSTSVPVPVSAPVINVNASTVKQREKEIDSFVKVVSPPPTQTSAPIAAVPQVPPIAKISGPSFASALAAASSGLASSSSSSIGSASSIPYSSSLKTTASSSSKDLSIFAELETFLSKKFPSENLKRNTLDYMASSYQNLPDNYELERTRQYSPKQPYAMPSFYPSEPPQILNNPSIFERFDLDTLFFIFYYQQKTYSQYLAARELKKQSWRFHKKYLTWFQRHEEPKVITNDYEQGTYIYFDYEGSWCQRKKTEFTFEYRYLEDEEVI